MGILGGKNFVGMLEMQAIVDALNGKLEPAACFPREEKERLERTIRAWFECPDLYKLERFQHPGDPTFRQMAKSIEVLIIGGSTRQAQTALSHTFNGNFADGLFVRLTLNSESVRLALPCENPRCARWYLKKRLGKSKYCSRNCLDTWKLTSRRRDAAKDKLDRLRTALKNWKDRGPRFAAMSWREWLREAEPGITPNFVTRAITEGRLEALGSKRV